MDALVPSLHRELRLYRDAVDSGTPQLEGLDPHSWGAYLGDRSCLLIGRFRWIEASMA